MWLPCSAIFPLSITIILSTFTIVANLCAIKIDVLFFEILSIDCWINCSVVVSILAVASSKINIEGCNANIRANASNCFSPAEKEFPLSCAISLIPFGSLLTKFDADDNSSASFTCSSEISLNNFILFLIDVAYINGSWRIVPMFLLKSEIFISLILTPSIKISPFWIV